MLHFWKYVKSKTKVKSTIGELKNDKGEFTEDPLGKANISNDYFSSVFTRENPSNIPDVHDRSYSASLEPICIDQDIVKRYLLQLKPGKSMGVDNIHPAILKNLSEVFATPLTEIFQTSIESGKLPCNWKEEHIILIVYSCPI